MGFLRHAALAAALFAFAARGHAQGERTPPASAGTTAAPTINELRQQRGLVDIKHVFVPADRKSTRLNSSH